MRKKWRKFHSKYLERLKFKYVEWLDRSFPGKYCWADCVCWAISSSRLNPFKIDSSQGCNIESITHPCKLCYCGGWQNGRCWDLMTQEERDKITREREAYADKLIDDLPF